MCRIFYVKCLVKATLCSIVFSDTNCAYSTKHSLYCTWMPNVNKTSNDWVMLSGWQSKHPRIRAFIRWVAAFKLLNLWITNRNDHQVNCRSQVPNTPYMYDGHPTRVLQTSYGGPPGRSLTSLSQLGSINGASGLLQARRHGSKWLEVYGNSWIISKCVLSLGRSTNPVKFAKFAIISNGCVEKKVG